MVLIHQSIENVYPYRYDDKNYDVKMMVLLSIMMIRLMMKLAKVVIVIYEMKLLLKNVDHYDTIVQFVIVLDCRVMFDNVMSLLVMLVMMMMIQHPMNVVR